MIVTQCSALSVALYDMINIMSNDKIIRSQSTQPYPIVGGFRKKHCFEFVQHQFFKEPSEEEPFARNGLCARISSSYLFRNSTNKTVYCLNFLEIDHAVAL